MSNDKFEWTDELVESLVGFLAKNKSQYHEKANFDLLNQFKQEQLKSKRDWEIVAFTAFDGKKYINQNGINSWISNGDVITSIRRKSDGEVFSVGDSVTWGAIPNLYIGSIKRFYIQDCNLCFDTEDIPEVLFQDGAYKLQHAKKQPLFTTEDGVDIFKGDEYWYVVTSDYDCLRGIKWRALKHKADWERGRNSRPQLGAKQFSTEDLANDYILMNKPMLSVKDVLALDVNIDLKMSKAEANRAGMDDGDDCCVIRNKDLIQLAKDKMNKK